MIARSQIPLTFRPRLVLGYVDSTHAALTSRHFRRLGWEVHLAGSASEAHRLVRAMAPEVVVLDINLRDESGWLTCVKLRLTHPGQKVILLTSELNDYTTAFADHVGAVGVVSREDAPEVLVQTAQDAILGQNSNLPAVVG